jgi:hypothetical protein
MLVRRLDLLLAALDRAPVVALVGPRQVGKTTLARQLALDRNVPDARFFDLERVSDRAALTDPDALLASLGPGLTVFDEVHLCQRCFSRCAWRSTSAVMITSGQFLVLGSASLDLLQSASGVARGTTGSRRTGAVHADKTGADTPPSSGCAKIQIVSRNQRRAQPGLARQFVQSYLHRDIPMFAPRLPRETLRRFWTMLAHLQGAEFNAAQLARNLDVSAQSITRYLDLLCDLFLIRRLPAHSRNIGKRLRKSPKVYVRDSGIVHALLGIATTPELLAHPVIGGSFEGFVIEHLMAAAGAMAECSFYRTQDGAEIDLLVTLKRERIAIEIKRSASTKPSRGFHIAGDDVEATQRWFVHGEQRSFPLPNEVQALNLADAINRLQSLQRR